MKAFALLLALGAITFLSAAEPGAGKLAFQRETAVWLAELDGKNARKIADGQAPELSPDGTRLAYNTVQPVGQPAHRKIAVLNIATGETRVFESVPSDNCLIPRWSPDGTRLLFYHYVENQMRLGLIGADGSDFRDLNPGGKAQKNTWSAAWAADGKSIFVQDMETLFHRDLEGAVLAQWKIEQLIPRGGMSGEIRLHAAKDGRTLLMDVEMAEKARKGWAGPPPSIWTFDLETRKATRLTPPGLYAWDAQWLDATTLLFSSQAPGESEPSIYRMSLTGAGKDRQRLAKAARLPSGAR